MTLKVNERRIANEICRKLRDGLSFSCEIDLIKRSLFSLQGKKYLIKTDAPECVIKDIKIIM